MGICYTSKAFQVSKGTRDRVEKGAHYYIDMELGVIYFDDEIQDVVDSFEWDTEDGSELSFEDILNEMCIVDCEDPDGWGYGLGNIYFYETSSGDVVCIVNYAY